MSRVKIEELLIKKAIIHILDTSLSMPILSPDEMATTINTNEYFATQISKIMSSDELRECEFEEEYNLFFDNFKKFGKGEYDFVPFSRIIAGSLFGIMHTHITIPAADLAVVMYRYQQEDYLAMLKLNYKEAYIHQTDPQEGAHRLIQYRTTLPGMNQRVSEAAIMNVTERKVYVLDKVYEIDGEKRRYLSQLFFKCNTVLSSKEKYKAIDSSLKRVTKKFFDGDIEKTAEIAEKLYESLDNDGAINLDDFSRAAFGSMEEVKEILHETLEKKGIEDSKVTLEEATIERVFNFKKIKTDDGIEIKIPMIIFNNDERMKFVTAEDGRIEIHLRNINKIV